MNHFQKQNNSGAASSKVHQSNSLEPCHEPENENSNMPVLLSPALSKASSGYFPQSSFTSTHSYYSTAEDNNIEEEKTSGGKALRKKSLLIRVYRSLEDTKLFLNTY